MTSNETGSLCQERPDLDCCNLTQNTWMYWLREVLSAQSYQLCLAKLLSALHKHEQ